MTASALSMPGRDPGGKRTGTSVLTSASVAFSSAMTCSLGLVAVGDVDRAAERVQRHVRQASARRGARRARQIDPGEELAARKAVDIDTVRVEHPKPVA